MPLTNGVWLMESCCCCRCRHRWSNLTVYALNAYSRMHAAKCKLSHWAAVLRNRWLKFNDTKKCAFIFDVILWIERIKKKESKWKRRQRRWFQTQRESAVCVFAWTQQHALILNKQIVSLQLYKNISNEHLYSIDSLRLGANLWAKEKKNAFMSVVRWLNGIDRFIFMCNNENISVSYCDLCLFHLSFVMHEVCT